MLFPRDRVDVRNRVLEGKAGNTSILSAVRIRSINRGMHLILKHKNKMALTNVVGKDKLVIWCGEDLYIA